MTSLLSIDLRGTPQEMGWQHGRQVQGVRPLLMEAMAARLADLQEMGAGPVAVVDPMVEALRLFDQPLLAFLRGLARSLALDEGDLLRYTFSSYLKDLERGKQDRMAAGIADGCTTWAVTAPVAQGDLVLLAKNRDYYRDHISLLLARVTPVHGYRYLTLGSAGSPNVYSSGINERGLAVADTRVFSHDLGPGMARYSLMREVMEQHATVDAALDYLRSVPHMGGGTIMLADATGQLAVWESGHQKSSYRTTHEGYLVSTNHFVSPRLSGLWMEDDVPACPGNSEARYRRVQSGLAGNAGDVDIAWTQSLAAAHGSALDGICRHPPDEGEGIENLPPPRSTISSVILLPRGWEGNAYRQAALLVAAGQPCQTAWEAWHV